MSIVLFDGIAHQQLLPLTYTRPVGLLHVGILTIQDKWSHYLGEQVRLRTMEHLQGKFHGNTVEVSLGVFAGLLPTQHLVDTITQLKNGEVLVKNGQVLALKPLPEIEIDIEEYIKELDVKEYDLHIDLILRPWDIFRLNKSELENDFDRVTQSRVSETIDNSNTLLGNKIFIEKGAIVSCSVLNSKNGPIYIGKNAEVMEGCLVRGGFALCEGATLKMGAKIYGASTVGPHSKVGGEVSNSVIQGYSNKGHDGFLGNSVLGEWCNLGADTNTSNLKNNYGPVRAWSYREEKAVDTELQFCGLIMGDHSKSAINTMFNTGTVVGVCANVFDGGFPSKHIPSYAWGHSNEDGSFETFKLEKAYEVAERVIGRRDCVFSDDDKQILSYIFESTKKYRK